MMYLIVSAMSSEVRGSLKLSNIDPAPDTAPNSVETRPGQSCDKCQVFVNMMIGRLSQGSILSIYFGRKFMNLWPQHFP